jgi:acyl CoA:acetate/3-ketoacid CoA transferase beta subunit
MIFTDIAVMQITERGILLREVAPGWTAEEIQALTEPQMIIADDLKEIEI